MKKTIGIINRPANRKNAELFREKGFEVLPIPFVSTEKIKNQADLDETIKKLLNFDWLVFTDIFAVDYFVKELNERDFDLYELDNLRICAFGEVVADRLRFSQIHTDVIPRKLSDEYIIKDLINYNASDNEIKCLTFLIIKGEGFENSVSKRLKNLCKNLTEISVYTANIKETEGIAKTKVLIESGAFDEIILFSAEDLQSFRMIVGNKSFKGLAEIVKLISKIETVQKSIEELNF